MKIGFKIATKVLYKLGIFKSYFDLRIKWVLDHFTRSAG